ncbi:extensin [Streptomyces sp. NPDC013157]|uniref:extensin n=1 Tax=Streptomyces sp. NPDC013157 TaxID=3364861 RepID=UPI0036B1059B
MTTPPPTGPAAPLPLFVQRAATPPAALPVKPATTTSAPTPAQPVTLRPTTPISATTPLPVAPLGRVTVQRDALTTASPGGHHPTSSLKKAPATHTSRPAAPRTQTSRQPPPPDGPPPPGYSASASAADDPPPGYTAVEAGGFDPRALTEFQVDALVHRIIDRITRHVRTELRRDRERVGKLRDFRP